MEDAKLNFFLTILVPTRCVGMCIGALRHKRTQRVLYSSHTARGNENKERGSYFGLVPNLFPEQNLVANPDSGGIRFAFRDIRHIRHI